MLDLVKKLSRIFFSFHFVAFPLCECIGSQMKIPWKVYLKEKQGKLCVVVERFVAQLKVYILFQNQTDVGQLFQRYKKPLNTQNLQ